MMWCGVVTIFPDMLNALKDFGIVHQAIHKNLLTVACWNPRDFTTDRHQSVDDRPYGGGPGMVMKYEPLQRAIGAARKAISPKKPKVIGLSPQGRQIKQEDICRLARESDHLIFVAGRYEGIDERLLEAEIDEEWSIGDYVLTGGELAAMVMIDAITRFLPGAVGDESSVMLDSFSDGLLDYPHYTRPAEVQGKEVPAVLLSGDHEKIAEWRRQQQIERTWRRRPDLLKSCQLNEKDNEILQRVKQER